jgi:hypothetical protein
LLDVPRVVIAVVLIRCLPGQLLLEDALARDDLPVDPLFDEPRLRPDELFEAVLFVLDDELLFEEPFDELEPRLLEALFERDEPPPDDPRLRDDPLFDELDFDLDDELRDELRFGEALSDFDDPLELLLLDERLRRRGLASGSSSSSSSASASSASASGSSGSASASGSSGSSSGSSSSYSASGSSSSSS